MEITVKSSEELNKLLDALAQEIVDANICHRLYCDVTSSIKENARAFRQSNTFWYFTFLSLDDARLLRLCRVFDQESNSLNLYNLLETIKANQHYFEENHFRERLKDNAFVEALARDDRIPDKEQLDKDICFASIQNPLVYKLILWRHNIIAHLGAKVSLGNNKILKDNPLSKEEIETLLDESFSIFNRYSSLYRATTFSRQVIGHDDFMSLLKFMNLGLQKWDEDIDNERKEMKKRQAEQ
ncbi:MAG: hypothetical protein KAI70_05635 [Candidatus Omnitrophica bacterium]|nr:hypothetical protein [Candidatus Omnitrophota bacterium]